MRIARTFATITAMAAATVIAAGPAVAEPTAPPVPAVPVAGAPAAPAAPAPAAAPAAPAVPAAAPGGAAPATPALVSTANAIPASAQPALTELTKIPGVQQILATGQLPTTDVATLVKMFGSDPNAQKLIAQVLAGQTAAAATPATPDEPLKFPVTGAINEAFTKDGGQKKYGQPLGVEKDIPGGAKVQEFANGAIYWNPKVAGGKAAGVVGAIRDAYTKEGGPTGKLGFPMMSELSVGGPTPGSVAGAYNDFQNGSIVWSPEGGAQVVSGKIKDQWVKGGGAFGMGYPKGPAKPGPGGVLTQEFTKGGVLKG
ncbi:LGFP repeat protein OS=Tsukamurella paurometabola (strain ATCC 8368 / DSM / CCUG 35730 / CIP 100753 / JCM 10117 / KCTC 9821 / NBRC 16120 / NCIMB 702349/ NCTC 13040) OX=521096 GN=Tpau_2565 PE=4 SV=1 [Tsukamurella paurometabola]|uniref:LGFP repeat protein n=1 Tax=Tsukamurella paurometabola (strain ATCC 8368 / DSM 20162 / CCUG 35730 / CIP 100753 / JCM 10117 / KCTC 9821 / NBRC 16120 / NCIMB 702349 / NCTC 13040) TaxID=521096 RepID=D5URW3_TSUPD|nr:LGFP repeat-containing protein [Tsukamurella paurometabola]ADG79168.1 LGFP repeat protein [Tsukamurella paurometabola DSM 20162]SUP34369.1 LGFP repeat [Tsukamurella paurometabola]